MAKKDDMPEESPQKMSERLDGVYQELAAQSPKAGTEARLHATAAEALRQAVRAVQRLEGEREHPPKPEE